MYVQVKNKAFNEKHFLAIPDHTPFPTHLEQLEDIELGEGMVNFESPLQNGGRSKHDEHDSTEVLPLGELLQDAEQVDGGEEVTPAESLVGGATLPDVGVLHVDRIECTAGEIQGGDVVASGHVLADILVEELEHERDAVGKDQVLTQILKLVDVVHFEVLEEEKKGGRDGLHNHLLVAVHVHRHLARLLRG